MKCLPTLVFLLISVSGTAALAQQPTRITVLTYNIHHGEGSDGQVDLERIAAVIAQVKPDLVALQEVDKLVNRSGKVDQTAELARLTQMHGYFFKQLDFDGGTYGQAILSRTEARELAQDVLPGSPERERRLLGRARFEIEGHTLWFATTHLHHANQAIRLQQAEAVNQLFASITTQGVLGALCGDFNAPPESPTMQCLSGAWKISGAGENLPTFPADKPTRQLDYVMLRPAAKWKVIAVKTIAERVASDHAPLQVELQFSP